MGVYNPGHQAVLDEMLSGYPQVRRGKLFGYPGYFALGKLCVCLYEDGIGVKLPQATVQRLIAEDAHAAPFQPLGRRSMREWVQITLSHSEDYRDYAAILDESIRYVTSLQE